MPTRETFQIFFATLPAALTPLYIGELVRGALVARRHRHMTPIIVWVWLVERCSDVAALLLLWGWAVESPELAIAGGMLLVLAPWLLASRTLHRPGADQLHTAQLPVATIVASSALCSLAAWIIPAVGAQVGLRVFAPVDLKLTTAAFVEGTLLGGISGVPGGAGIAGSAMIRHLQEGGIELPAAIASVAVLRAATNWYAVAVGIAVIVVCRKSLAQLLKVPRGEQQHFDELSPSYADGIPEHVRQRLLSRKIDAMLGRLPKPGGKERARGLDLGCGHAWYASELVTLGYEMTGIDVSAGQVHQAEAYCRGQRTAVTLAAYDGERIPFPDASFDFVYSINVMHHVIQPDVRDRLFAEVVRVLKPGGVFLLHEMNVENALFRVYMSYVFPLLKRIDEGTELWIRPTRLPAIQGATWSHDIAYFTFLPEFLPVLIQRIFQPFERWLELSKMRKYSALRCVQRGLESITHVVDIHTAVGP
jgi:SAM-dependent methyltransferase